MPPKRSTGRKVEDDSEEPQKKVSKKDEPKKKRVTKKATKEDAEVEPEDANEEKAKENTTSFSSKGNFKIASFNVSGIRAWLKKDGLSYLENEDADVYCLQETKCNESKMPEEVKNFKGYHCYFSSAEKEGYSGVAILSKTKPLKVTMGIGVKEHDTEGRTITAEYEDFYLVNAYVPNAGRGLVRLDYRMQWDEDFRKYLCKLDEQKPVVLTGDLNVAHEEIDLANPKTNKKNAGFTQEERDGLSAHLEKGFVDSFRCLHPDQKGAYTFWTYMGNARARNIGWRLDYFIVSKAFMEKVVDNEIRSDVAGSDHCPIVLHLNL